jgi:predicted O-linked N-acetylglucosamine transferase (SPINDLY family)
MKNNTKFNQILKRISNGEQIGTSELFSFIGAENRKERLYFNLTLANLYFNMGSYQHAYVCMQRAWMLSQFDERLIEQFFQIAKHAKKTDDIKNAYKHLGLSKLREKDLKNSLEYFNKWHNTETFINSADKYQYDNDILNAIDNYTKSQKFNHTNNQENKKVKIGYLIKGITVLNSVLIKINLIFAKYHNSDQFEITFFTSETLDEIKNSPQGINTISIINNYGHRIVTPNNRMAYEERLNSVAKSIFNERINILVTSAVLADFEHYYITSLKPAPIIIGLAQGPPPQFIAPNHMDWAISWTYHPLLDTPINCSHISLEMDFAQLDCNNSNKYKSELRIPEDGIILMSGGRPVKFQDKLFWNSVSHLLLNHSNLYFIAVGVTKEQIKNINDYISSNIEERITFLSWREDYLNILLIADIVIDTYPSGGGVFLLEAMNLGIPALTFENNYIKEFDQTDWSPISEFISNKDIICERGNFDQLIKKTETLIFNKKERIELGKKCKIDIQNNFGNPKRMVKKLENKYLEILNHLKNNDKESSDFYADDAITNFLSDSNFNSWQKAYKNGYNSSMGNHINYFYNTYISEIGFYNHLEYAKKIVEFAPGDATFMKVFIEMFPEKEFNLIDISEKNLQNIKLKLKDHSNVNYFLNYPEVTELKNIDVVFSFLLSQSMPKSLWILHLSSVLEMLNEGGAYYFQFAYHPNGFANDSIDVAINGGHKYTPEKIAKQLEDVGFSGCDFTVPISLKSFNTDIIWYLCKAYK